MLPDSSRPALRASDADREATADRLRIAAGEGRLDADELEERLTGTYASRYCHELDRLTADVTPPRVRPQPPARPVFVRPSRSTNGLAVASLVSGLLWMGGIGSILAVVFGHLALRHIARGGGSQAGRGIAIAGLTMGYFGVLMPLLFTLLVVLAPVAVD